MSEPEFYPEGTVSPSGKFVVRAGEWVPIQTEAPTNGAPQPTASEMTPGSQGFRDFLERSKDYGAARAAGPGVAILAAGATAGTAGAALRGALPFARPAAGLAKDLIVAQGIEEAAKASGVPGAGAVAEVVLGGKIVKGGAKALLEKAIASWAKKKAATATAATATRTVAKEAAPAVAKVVGSAVPAGGVKAAPYSFALKNSQGVKLGEKIWMLLDDAGNPLRVLTPDQAGAAARAGKATTWVKKTWK